MVGLLQLIPLVQEKYAEIHAKPILISMSMGGTPKPWNKTTGKTRDGGGVTNWDVPQGYSLTKEINTLKLYRTVLSPGDNKIYLSITEGKEVGVSFGEHMGKRYHRRTPQVIKQLVPHRTLRTIF